MLRRRAIMVLATALGSGGAPVFAAAPTPQFNLECDGTYSGGPRQRVDQPFHLTLVVDLDRGVYCNTDCSVVEPIYRVTTGEIVLEFKSSGMTTVIDRRSLAYTSYGSLTPGEAPFDTAAVCRYAPFTGVAPRPAAGAGAPPNPP